MTKELVPDLKICQEAKEKGVEIESELKINLITGDIVCKEIYQYEDCAPAPLTDEILKVLPWAIKTGDFKGFFSMQKDGEIYRSFYELGKERKFVFEDKKLSNALYLLYMKLKKEKII